jgi:hypothetical protein
MQVTGINFRNSIPEIALLIAIETYPQINVAIFRNEISNQELIIGRLHINLLFFSRVYI